MVFYRMVQVDRPNPRHAEAAGERGSLGPLFSKPERLREPTPVELESFARPGNEECAMTQCRKVLGIDVSKATLDSWAAPTRAMKQFPNDESGIAALIAWAHELKPELIVLEASGGYETAAA